MIDALLSFFETSYPILGENPIFLYALFIGIGILVVFIFRFIVLWYFKIYALLELLEKISTGIADTNFILRNNSKINTEKRSAPVTPPQEIPPKESNSFF
jgi:hypothetical protein